MKNNQKRNKVVPLLLLILDGWGIAKPNKGNAITLAKTPTMDGLAKKYPATRLCAHGPCVGLRPGQDGNSEAGHMNIGAGRVVEQEAVEISRSISNGSFFKNSALVEAIRHAEKNNSNLHLMGMLSNGMSAHSDPDHLLALLTLAAKNKINKVFLHLFTDGRDSPKYAASELIDRVKKSFQNGEQIATVMGRFYAMDRKKKWERTRQAYDALVLGEGKKAESAQAAITESYNREESDEFITPYIITAKGKPLPRIDNNDSVIFFNLRSDRARQLAKVFVQKNFNEDNPGSFKRKKVLKKLFFVAMTDFGPDLDSIITAFPSPDLKGTLPMLLGDLRQLYLAETEKYAHVTYFFNGGYADKVDAEDYLMVVSPDVKSYDETPTMRSGKLIDIVIRNLAAGRDGAPKYDVTVLNLAAPDMIGHTGNLQAGISCCRGVDMEVKKVVRAYLRRRGTVLITADHGNIEEMINLKTGEIDTEHSTNPVPFIVVNDVLKHKIKLKNNGVLGDIALTILDLLGKEKAKEMTGKSLIKIIHSI